MPQKILVVDDDPHVLDLIASALTRHRYAVSQASNTSEAKRLWATEVPAFDLLITDVRLEEADDGFMLAEKLLASHPDVPVMFTSGDQDCFASPAVQRFGDSPFIRKPFDLQKLIESVDDLLAGK